MARRHHRRHSNSEWAGVIGSNGNFQECAFYFYNAQEDRGPKTVSLSSYNTPPNISLEYSTDESNWFPIANASSWTYSITPYQYLYIRSTSTSPVGFSSSSGYYTFSTSRSLHIGGNIKSLLCKLCNVDIPLTSYCFYNLFNNKIAASSVSPIQWTAGSTDPNHVDFVLPFRTLTPHCYDSMFLGVVYDENAGGIPFNHLGSLVQATDNVLFLQGDMTHAEGCFANMFSESGFFTGQVGWINMKGISGSMPDDAFHSMFANCYNLSTAKSVIDELDWYFGGQGISNNGMAGMFASCDNLLSFEFSSWGAHYPVKYKGIYWQGNQDNYDDIYMDIYESKAPVRSAGMINMFANCVSLREAWLPPYAVVGDYAYFGMFNGCSSVSSLSYFHGNPILPAGIPYISGSHEINNPLAEGCYSDMFINCTSLLESPILPSMNLSTKCYRNMFANCSNILYIKMLGILDSNATYSSGWLSGCEKNPNNPGAVMVVSGTVSGANSWNVSGTSGLPAGWTIYNTYTEPFWIKNLTNSPSTLTIAKVGVAPNLNIQIWKEDSQVTSEITISNTTTLGVVNQFRRIFVQASSAGNTRTATSNTNYWRFGASSGTEVSVGGQLTSLLKNGGLSVSTNNPQPFSFLSLFYQMNSLKYAQELDVNFYYALSGGTSPNVNYMYGYTFQQCSNLKYPPAHIGGNLYNTTTSSRYQLYGMFRNCQLLRETPILAPITVNSQNCSYMFQCSNPGNIKKAVALFTNTPSESSASTYGTYLWFQNQTSPGMFYKASDATWNSSGDSAVPESFDVSNIVNRSKFTNHQPNLIYYLTDLKSVSTPS